jgi:hypothetical protein
LISPPHPAVAEIEAEEAASEVEMASEVATVVVVVALEAVIEVALEAASEEVVEPQEVVSTTPAEVSLYPLEIHQLSSEESK